MSLNFIVLASNRLLDDLVESGISHEQIGSECIVTEDNETVAGIATRISGDAATLREVLNPHLPMWFTTNPLVGAWECWDKDDEQTD